MNTSINIDEIKRFPTVTNPIKADDLHTPQAYAYTLRRAIVTDCNDRQRAELVKLLEGKESAEGVTFQNTQKNRDRLHIWQNQESRRERAAILGEGWQYSGGLNDGTPHANPGDEITCVDGTTGICTKASPEIVCIEFETADGRTLTVAGYFFRKERTIFKIHKSRMNGCSLVKPTEEEQNEFMSLPHWWRLPISEASALPVGWNK